jgi:hypothetical protein
MRTYNVTITGVTPLLMHQDNIEWSDRMDAWKNDPKNKKSGKAGDDRSPAYRWIGSTYHDGTHVALPADNIMRCLMEGGAMVLVPGGRNGKTFKAQTQSGIVLAEAFWRLEQNIEWASIASLIRNLTSSSIRRRLRNSDFPCSSSAPRSAPTSISACGRASTNGAPAVSSS